MNTWLNHIGFFAPIIVIVGCILAMFLVNYLFKDDDE